MPQGWSSAAVVAALLFLMARASPPAAPLRLLNPWLSACDMSEPATAPDLRGSCTSRPRVSEGPGPPCPPACVADNSTDPQCLHYLGGGVERLCSAPAARLQHLHLPHCCEHTLLGVLGTAERRRLAAGGESCRLTLDAVLNLDRLAAAAVCKFSELLARYDCHQPYSVAYSCSDCQEAYRRWACGSLLPHFVNSGETRVRPCRSECQLVEQRCPFFLPGDRAPPWDRAPVYPTQYAGEPTFLCLDPHIPETGEQLGKSLYGPASCCFEHCGPPGTPLCCRRCDGPCPPDRIQHVPYCAGLTNLSALRPEPRPAMSACPSTVLVPAAASRPHPTCCWTTMLELLLHIYIITKNCDATHSLLRHTVTFILVRSFTLVWGNT